MTASASGPSGGRDGHYSYAHYANRDVAEGFDALRFSGPIGRFLLEEQERLLLDALAPVKGRTVADVGTGTGRAAIGLAGAGALVTGLDASAEMLDVARARAAEAHLSIQFEVADAHALPLADQTVDAAVCLRVIMHTIDWSGVIDELCRVSKSLVVVDFPSASSFAALESRWRRRQQKAGRAVEAYRVLAPSEVARALEGNGFRVVSVRRQFVLPINLHKKIGSLGFTRFVEGLFGALGLLALFGSPVTMVARR